jgi:citrate lyase subunit beta/citryl-CoA lyase
MRSWLFAPGDEARKLEKAWSSGTDVVIADLEDSVALPAKEKARSICAGFLAEKRGQHGPLLCVRINPLESGLAQGDIDAVLAQAPAMIMLPKSANGMAVTELAAMLRVAEAEAGLEDGSTGVIAIVTETAAATLATGSYAGVSSRLQAMTWGAEDLSADIGAEATREAYGTLSDVFRLARAMALLGANAAGALPIDTVFTNFRDDTGLAAECAAAMRDGFVGKLAIHPNQIGTINQAFTPSAAQIERAQAVIDAFAASGNAGVTSLDGQMLDRPHLIRAERLLARARIGKS